MSLTLNALERRVLGVLLEKSLAQPEYYPMTINAIAAGCNQKNNRDPVMELDEDTVWQTLEVLRAKHLISKVLPSGSSRVDRYKHEVEAVLKLDKAPRAILTELLLRGPQTVGELRTRAYRLYAFENLEAVSAVLDLMAQNDPPLVGALPRGQRESAIRFAHRLYEPDEQAVTSPSALASDASDRPASAPARAPLPAAERSFADERIGNLEDEVGELRRELDSLRRRLDTLEGRM